MALARERVLLVNPPVVDSRYPWVKWNQPLDLLKLGTFLAQTRGCEVRLFDFMLPTPKGTVPRQQSRISQDLPPGEPVRWHYGQPWEAFDAYLAALAGHEWIPDSVWITTLTSFWWQSVPLVADRVKNRLRRPFVVVCGNYPLLETEHAARFCPNIDIVVRDRVDLTCCPPDFSLYGKQTPAFCALDLRDPQPAGDIERAMRRGMHHFVFFNENIFADFGTLLKPVLQEVVSNKWKAWFHGICGVETRDFPVDDAQLLADAHFSELHFEPALNENGMVDEQTYRNVMLACRETGIVSKRGAGWEARGHDISGFLWIGQPHDDSRELVWNALKLLQLVGMVIPKPYSPTPGSDNHAWLIARAGEVQPEDTSPHRLPCAGWNGMAKSDYEDLYRLTAFLNLKVHSHTFDFLGDTYLAKTIRRAMAGRRWSL